jgi:Ca2+-binding RTX toxin-like protein
VRKEGNQMRTTTILITLMSVMVVVFAGVALAAVINGNDNDNHLVGTPRDDTIKGFGGDDRIDGGQGGDDTLFPGSGEDRVRGAQGKDVINAVDTSQDRISCGSEFDRVRANPGDVVLRQEPGGPGFIHPCEKVIRDGIRVEGPFD